MKCISIRPPWGWLIVNGHKDVENRTWPTRYRGPLLVHQSKKIDTYGAQWIKDNFNIPLPAAAYQKGGIIGSVSLVDCVKSSPSPWFFGPWGFLLADPTPLDFHACRGQLGIYNVTWPPGDGEQTAPAVQKNLF